MSQRYTLHHGDCIKVMRSMPDALVDSIVTDPPYELTGKSGRGGFMGKEWDATGIAFNPEMWSEALRVLKPGGHLLAFSGSRTYHRMAVAIEDAGFEIRDQIMWIYGSGFPKSLDVSKAIDKAAGFVGDVVGTEVVDVGMQGGQMHAGRPRQVAEREVRELSDEARRWSGFGTALKPAHEPIVVARKPLQGTVAANVLAHGVGALNIDGCRVGDTVETWPKSRSYPYGNERTYGSSDAPTEETQTAPQGRWPANVIHDGSDEVVALFPSNTSPEPRKTKRSPDSGNRTGYGVFSGQEEVVIGYGDSGSAARFFYCAKANKKDRNEGLDGFAPKFSPTMNDGIGGKEHNPETATKKLNHHPTVKPTDLMRYLIRLVTPQGATILDPFMGSGSTGKAAMYEGVNFIGIEQDAEYLAIAQARIKYALNKPLEDQLFERTTPTTDELIQDQLPLPLKKEETA